MTEDPAVPMTKVYGERALYDNPWVRHVHLRTASAAIVLDDAGHVFLLRRHRFATAQVGWGGRGRAPYEQESFCRTG